MCPFRSILYVYRDLLKTGKLPFNLHTTLPLSVVPPRPRVGAVRAFHKLNGYAAVGIAVARIPEGRLGVSGQASGGLCNS